MKTITAFFLGLSLTVTSLLPQEALAIEQAIVQIVGQHGPMDMAKHLRITDDNGSYIAGHRPANAAGEQRTDLDAFVVRQDAEGRTLWQQNYGGEHDEILTDLLLTVDGGALLVGGSRSTAGTFAANHGHFDYWICKIDSHGAVQWSTILGSSAADVAYAAAPTKDGGYWIAGATYGADGDVAVHYGNADCWLVKLNAHGELIHQKNLGGALEETPKTLHALEDGTLLMTATTLSQNGDITANSGSYDAWTVKLDAEGEILWQVCSGGTGVDRVQAAHPTTDGGIILAVHSMALNGHYDSSPCHMDIWLVKLDAQGVVQWENVVGGSGDEEAVAILPTGDGGYLLAGHTSSRDGHNGSLHGTQDGWIVKLSSNGMRQWDTCLAQAAINYARDLQLDAHGSIRLLGTGMDAKTGIQTWIATWPTSHDMLMGIIKSLST
ncbi:MAG TPA: hypothetical protein VIK71_02540 [Flavobacteriales bacterium]